MIQAMQSRAHYPVMLPEVLGVLKPQDGGVYVDGTFGIGGYSSAVLDAAECRVYAIDRDLAAVAVARAMEKEHGGRFVFLRGCFGDVRELLSVAGVEAVDGFVLDIGVSSVQLDTPERGFSFRFDAPLDMRMDTEVGVTAADIVNTYDEADLADIIYLYGEERYSRRIARKIVQMRAEKSFSTTFELAEAVRSVVPRSSKDKIDQATRTFQALRIVVNDELGELERALEAAVHILKPGGRLVVVSFHSLEDGIVKRFFKEKSQTQSKGSRHMPQKIAVGGDLVFENLTRKSVKPSENEIAENPRSRSARLRAAVRVQGGRQ